MSESAESNHENNIKININTKPKAEQLLKDLGLKAGMKDSLETTLASIKNKISQMRQAAGDDWEKISEVDVFAKRYTELQNEYNESKASAAMFNQSANVASSYAQAFIKFKH